MADLQALADAIINGKQDDAKTLTQAAIDEGLAPKDVLSQGLIAGMDVVGERFKNCEFYIPEVLVAARAMKAAMAIVKPLLSEADQESAVKVAIGTVQGDLHDIGKNLVAMMLEGAGFTTVDLGVDVAPEKYVASVKEQGVKVIGLSALLTTTMPAMKDTIAACKEAGIRDDVVIMIGGAPVTQDYADEIGANGFAPDAASAVDKIKELLAA